MLQPLNWIQSQIIKPIGKAFYRIQYKRRVRRHARATALRPMRRLQARTIPTMGAQMRARKQPSCGQRLYNAHIQRAEPSVSWWTRKKPLSKLLKEVQATPRKE